MHSAVSVITGSDATAATGVRNPHATFARLAVFAQALGDTSAAKIAQRLELLPPVVGNWAKRGVSRKGAVAAQDLYGCSADWVLGAPAAPGWGCSSSHSAALIPLDDGHTVSDASQPSREQLLLDVSQMLRTEIPESFLMYAEVIPPFDPYNASDAGVDGQPATPVNNMRSLEISHGRGATYARYHLTCFGKHMTMYVQMNVMRISVVYFLPTSLGPHIADLFRATAVSERSLGWVLADASADQSNDPSMPGFFAEYAALKELGDGFLASPVERLFLCNELASMTLDVMLAWSRLAL